MATWSAIHDQMEYVGGEMEGITNQIATTLSDLDDAAKQRLSEWSSDARAAYDDAKRKWDQAAAQMQQLAGTATTALQNITANYRSGENYGVSLWEQ